jgi:hypothetical protein
VGALLSGYLGAASDPSAASGSPATKVAEGSR